MCERWTPLPGQEGAMESFVLGARIIRSVPEKMVLTIVFEIDGGGGGVNTADRKCWEVL